jgi:hypothetical protein
MKNKKQQDILHKPIHLHVEHFFRKQYVLLAVLAIMAVALIKTDGKLMGVVRDAYAEGFGMVGQYMREETTRMPAIFNLTGRIPTISGK